MEAQAALLRREAPMPMIAPPQALRILIVEDNEADAYLIERTLKALPKVGTVMRASNGEVALKMLEDGAMPDLAIIDLQMPRKNGFSLLVELTYRAMSFPMIVLTSSTTRSDAIRSKLRGASQVLTKPYASGDWQAILSKAIDLVDA